jgi:hypothetical protein
VQIYRQGYCRTRRRNGYLPFVLYFAHITATRAIDDDRANTAKFSNKWGLNSQYRPLPVSSLVLILPMLDAGVWHCDAFLCLVSLAVIRKGPAADVDISSQTELFFVMQDTCKIWRPTVSVLWHHQGLEAVRGQAVEGRDVQVSTDPELEAKVADVIGLYLTTAFPDCRHTVVHGTRAGDGHGLAKIKRKQTSLAHH